MGVCRDLREVGEWDGLGGCRDDHERECDHGWSVGVGVSEGESAMTESANSTHAWAYPNVNPTKRAKAKAT